MILAVVCVAQAMIGVDQSLAIVAFPSLVEQLQASSSELQWIANGFTLFYAAFVLTGGALADRFGRVRIGALGLTMFGAASTAAAFMPTAAAVIPFRFVQGAGGALISPACMSIISATFTDRRELARAVTAWAAFASAGALTGPLLGGLLLSHFWWGSVFLVSLPLAICSAIALLVLVPESRSTEFHRFDPIGVLLSAAGLASVVWALIGAPNRGWLATPTVTALAIGAALVGLFVGWERRVEEPMMDVALFADRRFTVPTLVTMIQLFANTGFGFSLTLLLRFVYGYSVLGAGQRIIPNILGFLVGGLLATPLTRRIGSRGSMTFGLSVAAVGGLVFSSCTVSSGYGRVVLAMMLLSGGGGLSFTAAMESVMRAISPERAGAASGANNMSRQSSVALGVAVVGSILTSGYRSSLRPKLAELGVDPDIARRAEMSIGSAVNAASTLDVTTGDALRTAARSSYIHGQSLAGLTVAAACALGALLALRGQDSNLGAPGDAR
jgi:EmrB/QacA subfamily drug resistance transporter